MGKRGGDGKRYFLLFLNTPGSLREANKMVRVKNTKPHRKARTCHPHRGSQPRRKAGCRLRAKQLEGRKRQYLNIAEKTFFVLGSSRNGTFFGTNLALKSLDRQNQAYEGIKGAGKAFSSQKMLARTQPLFFLVFVIQQRR